MRTSKFKKLDTQFLDRWSPRAFLSEQVELEDIYTLFEAARWSPSCFNEQPWRFIFARNSEDLAQFRSVLNETNQKWANKAPILVFAFSAKTFERNGRDNRFADFDTGAAWMALTLQANKLGLHTHGMAGFDIDKAYQVTGMDREKYNVLCAIAIGKKAQLDTLSEEFQQREVPNDRRPLTELVYEGHYALENR